MTRYVSSVNIVLNLLINYDTNYNLLHHHSQRFNFRFLVSNADLITLSKFHFLRLCPIIIHPQKTRFPVTTYIFFVKDYWNTGFARFQKNGVGRHFYGKELSNIEFSGSSPLLKAAVGARLWLSFMLVVQIYPNFHL